MPESREQPSLSDWRTFGNQGAVRHLIFTVKATFLPAFSLSAFQRQTTWCPRSKLQHDDHDGARKPHSGLNEAQLRLATKLYQHPGHGPRNQRPLVHHERLVDSQPNETDAGFAGQAGGDVTRFQFARALEGRLVQSRFCA